MKDFSDVEKKLRDIDGLRRAADSAEGQKLLQGIDQAALEKAAKSGDVSAMKSMLARILATPEGKALSQKVKEAIKDK